MLSIKKIGRFLVYREIGLAINNTRTFLLYIGRFPLKRIRRLPLYRVNI